MWPKTKLQYCNVPDGEAVNVKVSLGVPADEATEEAVDDCFSTTGLGDIETG